MKRLTILLALVAALCMDVAPAQAGGCVLRQPGAQDTMYCGPAHFDSISSGTSQTAPDLTATDDLTVGDDSNLGDDSTDITTITGIHNESAESVRFACRNESGGAFAAGDLVYITDWDGDDVPLMVLADADAGLPAHAVMAGALADATTGVCYTRLEVTGLNTSAAATEGDEVCLTPTATTTNTWAVEASCTAVLDEFRQVAGVVTVDHASTGAILFDLRSQDIRKWGSANIQNDAIGSEHIEPLDAALELDQDAGTDHAGLTFTGASIDAVALNFAGTYAVTGWGGANFGVVQSTAGANVAMSATDDGTLATAGGSIAVATKANHTGLGYGVQLLTAPSGYSVADEHTPGIALLTGAQTGTTGNTGAVSITSGNSTNGDSGSIGLTTGTAGATRGSVNVSALNLAVTANITSIGTAPAASSCGTSPAVIGSDTAGKVTVGSSASAVDGCVLTFAVAKSNAPACMVIGDDSAMNLAATTSTTALTITSTAAGDPSGDVWMYLCVGQDAD